MNASKENDNAEEPAFLSEIAEDAKIPTTFMTITAHELFGLKPGQGIADASTPMSSDESAKKDLDCQ